MVLLAPAAFVEADLGGDEGARADKVVSALVPSSSMIMSSATGEMEEETERRRGGGGRGESVEDVEAPRAVDCGRVCTMVAPLVVASSNSVEKAWALEAVTMVAEMRREETELRRLEVEVEAGGGTWGSAMALRPLLSMVTC